MRAVLLILIAALAACAGQPEARSWEEKLAARGYVVAEPVTTIRNYRINGWNELDRSHVIIEAGVSERYLLTLLRPCDGVRTANTLAFSTSAGALTKFDQLYVRGPGNRFENCRIDTVHRLERVKGS